MPWDIPNRMTEPMLFAYLSNLSDIEEESAKPGAITILNGIVDILIAARLLKKKG